MSAPAPSTPTPRFSRTAIVLAALVLLLPLGFIFLLSGGRERRISPAEAAPASAAAPTDAEGADPEILATADPSVPAWGKLKEPRGAAIDPRGRLWIADFGNSRLRIYDSDGGYLGGWGGKGDGRHTFRDLTAVDVGGDDVYVADTWNGRIERFGLDGTWKGAAPGLFGPRGLAVAADGDVWVADTGNHRVVHYDAALKEIETLGRQGTGSGEYSSPVGIAAVPGGLVYVADTGNRRIVLLDDTGKFRSAWTVPGWDRPVEPALEPDGKGGLWASDPGTAEAVMHFDSKGNVIDRRTKDDQGQRFSLPTGLALESKAGVLYVVNSGKNTVSKVSTAAPPAAHAGHP